MLMPNLYSIALGLIVLAGCDGSSSISPDNVKHSEKKLGKLVTVADKIEFKDGRLLITRPALSDDERSKINGKSLLFSKLAIVDVNVGMLAATPYIHPLQLVVDVDVPSRHVFVVDVDTHGIFGEPRTEAVKSIEVLPP
ncbi:MAG: hypothetical protein C0485_12555 [Pirellula sp.]|nr:hypothetical protein [Pirellula sp.]